MHWYLKLPVVTNCGTGNYVTPPWSSTEYCTCRPVCSRLTMWSATWLLRPLLATRINACLGDIWNCFRSAVKCAAPHDTGHVGQKLWQRFPTNHIIWRFAAQNQRRSLLIAGNGVGLVIRLTVKGIGARSEHLLPSCTSCSAVSWRESFLG